MKNKFTCLLLLAVSALTMKAKAQPLNYAAWSSAITSAYDNTPKDGVVSVDAFGAVGDAVTDDTKALQAAFTYARDHNLTVINFGSGKKYKITGTLAVDYRGKGQIDRKGMQINGNGASIFLASGAGGRGYTGISIMTDPLPQQNTRFNINNIWFYTDNVNRPNAIRNSFGCFVTVQNCVFYQAATAVYFEYAGMCRFNNCFFWGCVEGIKTYRCKDTYIDGCHAYACDRGFYLEGVNNAGSDGNICIVNSVANQSTQVNLKLKGLYTPMVANCVFEQSPMNISVESCNFGKMSNVFCGPGNAEFISKENELTNDYWNIANFDAQGKVDLNGLKFSNVTGFKIHGVSANGNAASAALALSNCYEVNFAGLTLRDSRDRLAWSMSVAPDCSSLTISNLIADRSILLRGKVNDRPGRFILSTAIINGGVVTEDKQYKPTEVFEYIDSGSNTFHSSKASK